MFSGPAIRCGREPAAMQQITYGMALWIPYFGTAFNSLDPYIFRSQMAPAIGIGLEAGRYDHGYEWMERLITEWRRVADYYYGDYYPLTRYGTESADWIFRASDAPLGHSAATWEMRSDRRL
jgi:hypothetical protein